MHARANTRTRLLRRRFLVLALFYVVTSILALTAVVTGDAPLQSLIGLPISAGLVWVLIKNANAVKSVDR